MIFLTNGNQNGVSTFRKQSHWILLLSRQPALRTYFNKVLSITWIEKAKKINIYSVVDVKLNLRITQNYSFLVPSFRTWMCACVANCEHVLVWICCYLFLLHNASMWTPVCYMTIAHGKILFEQCVIIKLYRVNSGYLFLLECQGK